MTPLAWRRLTSRPWISRRLRGASADKARVDTLPTAFESAVKADRFTRIDARALAPARARHIRADQWLHAAITRNETVSRGRGSILTGGDQLHRIWLRIGDGSGDNAMVS